MVLSPLRKSPSLFLTFVILTAIFGLSLLSSLYLRPFLGELEATIASLFLNFVLTAALIVIYLGMARDQEDQTQLIERQVEIADLQREVMEVNHLPLLEIETGYDLHTQNNLDEYTVRIQNRGSAVALHPRFGINVHPIIRENPQSGEDLSENWDPILRPLQTQGTDELNQIDKIEPGETVTATATLTVRQNWAIQDEFELVEIAPTLGTQKSARGIESGNEGISVDDIDAVLWQAIISYDTLLPTRDTLYRFHQPLQIECSDGYALLEQSQYIPNMEDNLNGTSIQKPDTYDGDPLN